MKKRKIRGEKKRIHSPILGAQLLEMVVPQNKKCYLIFTISLRRKENPIAKNEKQRHISQKI